MVRATNGIEEEKAPKVYVARCFAAEDESKRFFVAAILKKAPFEYSLQLLKHGEEVVVELPIDD